MRNNNLDEMQLQRRNKIGNQAFMLLFYLLMIDIGLNGFGFRWLNYPANVLAIMTACMTYYLIRIIWNSSFVGPQQSSKGITRKTRYLIGATGFVGAVTAFILQKYFMEAPATNGDDNSAMILLVVSIVMLIIIAVVSIIDKWQNKKVDNN
ncbi:MAG: hypothetical protein APF81_19150 [Desulfosporosinus sp. BRH_c37]|nr:MAG: hypothetical protein APF81_19150 [Desulfosporosinus sp. BRH_c37]